MKCPKCHAENPDDSKFCRECGASLISSKDASVTKTLQTPERGFKKNTVIAKKCKIIEKLGEGGMGIVYKAKDTKLDRTVALKFLPAELTKDEEAKKRFIQEAKAAAALNHPQICTIYEIDETDDQTFISMEYIEGQSLKGKLRDGPMDIDEAKDIALQVAEGLKEAHEKGIVHRDIKPANIMLTKKGQAKITDFGLAKLSWGVDLTKPATILGTVAYMSPEQAKGEEVDHRTDIWSLGAMLYEMMSGERPFQKSQEQALIYAILNDKPTRLSRLRSDIPAHIEHLIERALAKKADERYQNVDDFMQDLIQSQPLGLPKTEKSIIVLPFENLSPDPDQEYFCDGMTEEIISDLSNIQTLKVISRSSAMTFKGAKKKIRDIAREVNVQYVLEGSVRKAGNNLRITAQLIDAKNDVHLWAKKYSGTLDDVFDIQEKVSRSIVDALELKLSPIENKKITERPIGDIQAYDLFIRARKEILSGTEEGLERALQLINRGISIIGENELLLGVRGLAYFNYFNMGFKKEEEYLRKVQECADKIFALNSSSDMGHFLKAMIYWKKGNIRNAVREYKRSLKLNPNHVDSLMQLSYFYIISGKISAARPWLARLEEIAPLEWLAFFAAGEAELEQGNFEAGLEYLSRMIKIEPENPMCQISYGHGLAYVNRLEESYEIFDQLGQDLPNIWMGDLASFFKLALKNKRTEAYQAVSEDLKKAVRGDEYMPIWMAEGYALIGEMDEAVAWLEEGVKWGFINYPFLNEIDPFLENIRGEERFKKLMDRVKHEWENFEV